MVTVLLAMQKTGIDLSEARPQKLTDELARQATLLITMDCTVREPRLAAGNVTRLG